MAKILIAEDETVMQDIIADYVEFMETKATVQAREMAEANA